MILFCLSSFNYLLSQTKTDIKLMKQFISKNSQEKPQYQEATNNDNELEFIFSSLFLFYKSIISSQDGSRCTFTPSCSHYGLKAIKHYGFIRGGMATFDRLSRCNGLSPENYEIDPKTKRLVDDVD